MKKTILLTFLLIWLLLFPAQAALGSRGLILEGGKEQLTLSKGEKEYLNVRDGLTHLPLFKGVTFYSDNTMVATVGQHSGIVRANGYGKAQIYAVSDRGDAGKIVICVRAKKAKAFYPVWIILALIIIGGLLWRKGQKNGIC